jgi:hypothetical protein
MNGGGSGAVRLEPAKYRYRMRQSGTYHNWGKPGASKSERITLRIAGPACRSAGNTSEA